MSNKPKTNRQGDTKKSNKYDRCGTPHYALDPLLPYIPQHWLIWEPAAGDGQICDKLMMEGYNVFSSDILTGRNFFDWQPNQWHCQITNPPYSTKYPWLARSYDLQKPFALLLPLEALAAGRDAQPLFKRYGIEIIVLNKRVNFNMPDAGYTGGGAQFPVAWFTWGLNIGSPLTFGCIKYYEDGQMNLL